MTTYSTISNAAVAVGGIPSSATVTALRDNPIAIAECASGAPINASAWHPYDKTTVGDGKTGLIYDTFVSGNAVSVTTPDFEDGYEYRVVGRYMFHSSSGSNRAFNIQAYHTGTAGYVTLMQSGGRTSTTIDSFDANILNARVASRSQIGFILNSWLSAESYAVSNTYGYDPLFKFLNVKLFYTTSNINSGQFYLYRRRDYASL